MSPPAWGMLSCDWPEAEPLAARGARWEALPTNHVGCEGLVAPQGKPECQMQEPEGEARQSTLTQWAGATHGEEVLLQGPSDSSQKEV